MKLLRKFLLCLSVVPTIAATFTQIFDDLYVVDGDIQSLTTKTNQYPGGASNPGAAFAAIQVNINKLTSDVNKAKTDLRTATPTPLPTADAQKYYNYVCVSPLYPDFQKWINALKAKRDPFINQGVKPTIKADCTNIKTGVDALFDVIISRAPTATLKSNSQTCKANYDNLLNDCISYFS